MRILLVEDDAMIGESVRSGLQQEGFTIDWVQDGRSAGLALHTGTYSLLLLDLGLPLKSGMELLTTIRQRGNTIPTLIITARDRIADRVLGLDTGADDYLVKPFDLDELAARMRALLRRQAGRAAPLLQCGELTLNPATHQVTHHGRPLDLSAREYALLAALLETPGAILSRAQLEEKLYGWGDEVESNAVEVHVHHLRKKLGENLIRTMRGLGYSITVP